MPQKFPRIVLASRSSARRALMKELKIPFECHASDYEEDMKAYKTPEALAKFLAFQKAQYIARDYPNAIIIGADTFLNIGRENIGKPANKEDAKQIIRKKSGRRVKVYSGVAVIHTDAEGRIKKKLRAHVATTLQFARITEKEIGEIVKKDDVLSVAGALTIEGESGKFVKTIRGDYHNVIGLPLFQLKEMLTHFGITV